MKDLYALTDLALNVHTTNSPACALFSAYHHKTTTLDFFLWLSDTSSKTLAHWVSPCLPTSVLPNNQRDYAPMPAPPPSPIPPPFPLFNHPWQSPQHNHAARAPQYNHTIQPPQYIQTSQPPQYSDAIQPAQQAHYPPSMPAITPINGPQRHDPHVPQAFQDHKHLYAPVKPPSPATVRPNSGPQEIVMRLGPDGRLVETRPDHPPQPQARSASGNNQVGAMSGSGSEQGHTTGSQAQQLPPNDRRGMTSDNSSQPRVPQQQGYVAPSRPLLPARPSNLEAYHESVSSGLLYGIPVSIASKRKGTRVSLVSSSPPGWYIEGCPG